MKTILTVLIILAAAAVILLKVRHKHALRRIPLLADDELRAVFDSPSNIRLFLEAAGELRKRGLDTDFILPHFIEMVLANNTTANRLGWTGLKTCFQDRCPGVNFSLAFPDADTRIRLKEIKQEGIGSA